MSSSIQDRLKKLPPFDEDIPMLQNLKKVSEQQVTKPSVEVQKEEPEEETQVEENVEEPKEEVKSRTAEQFDKLKKSNQELAEENKVLRQNVLESLKPQEVPQPIQQMPQYDFGTQAKVEDNSTHLSQKQVDDVFAKLFDDYGYIDPNILVSSLKEMNETAKRAEQRALEAERKAAEAEQKAFKKISDFEESREVRQVHKKFPMIDPNKKDSFNERFWEDVRNKYAMSPIYDGKNLSFMEAAEAVYEERYKDQYEKPKEREVEPVTDKQEQVEDAKRNINSGGTSYKVPNYYSSVDTDALRKATILNKKGAIAERLRRSGY